MFALRYSPAAGPGIWAASADRISGPCGWVEPFRHPMIEARGVVDGRGNLGVAVLERPHPSSGAISAPSLAALPGDREDELASARELTRRWPLHWFWIEIADGSLAIEASPLPTAPVFVAGSERCARAHWDPLELYPHVEPALDLDMAAHYLCTFEQPYGPRTVVRGLTQVAAGHRALWRPSEGWTLAAPPAYPQSYPRALAAPSDPVASFERLLDSALERLLPERRLKVATGVSGGLDSTAVAGTAARRGHPVSAFGLIMPGPEGAEQQERRRTVVERFGMSDRPSPTAEAPPWSSEHGRIGADRVVPWEELHYDLFGALYAKAAAEGHTVFLSGFGGDELVQPYWDELDARDPELELMREGCSLPPFLTARVRDGREERAAELMTAPAAFAQRSAMDAAAGAAAQHLRHGLWPIHLLITPEVVRYCHALPREWRERRRLMREMLRRWGLPSSVTDPASTESFSGISIAPLRQCPRFRALVRAPMLSDLGLVEPGAMDEAFRSWLAGSAPASWDVHFIAAVVLEATLASLQAAKRKRRPG
jgi:hypothetical protein